MKAALACRFCVAFQDSDIQSFEYRVSWLVRPAASARPVGPSRVLLSAEPRVLRLLRLVWGCKDAPMD